MPDRPIIFSAPMIRALLDGRKTQTRRLAWGRIKVRADGASFGPLASPWQRVQPSDRLWVREAWGTHAGPGIYCCEHDLPNAPRAGGGFSPVTFRADAERKAWGLYGPPKWRSPTYMPRRASRFTLTVTAVRVERLQQISEADAQAEGMADFSDDEMKRVGIEGLVASSSARRSFWLFWDHLHGPGAWDANPEVVVLTFGVAERNIDEAAP